MIGERTDANSFKFNFQYKFNHKNMYHIKDQYGHAGHFIDVGLPTFPGHTCK